MAVTGTISFVAASTTVVTGATLNITVPTGYAVGDLLVIVTTNTTTTPTTPTGWTALATQGSGQFVTIFYKFASQSEATVQITGLASTAKGTMLAYRGVGAIQTLPAFATGSSTSAATPTVTTTYANDYIVSFYSNTSGAARTLTNPTGTTNRVNSATTTTAMGLLVCDELQASIGTSATRSMTISLTSAWAAFAVALIPARTVYWVGGTNTWSLGTPGGTGAMWADTTGGAGGVVNPMFGDTVTIDGSSGSPTVTLGSISPTLVCYTLITTGATCTITGTGALTLVSQLALSATTTWSASGTLNLGYGAVGTNGVSISSPIVVNCPGGTTSLLSQALTTTSSFTLTAGQFNLNNQALTCSSFNASGAVSRTLAFSTSGSLTINGSGTVFDITTATNFAISGTTQVNISNNSATATTVITGALTAAQAMNFNYNTGTYTLTDTSAIYNNINFTGFAGTVPNQTRIIYGNWTNPASGVTFTGGTLQTTFNAPSATQTVTTNGVTLDFPIIYSPSAAGSFVLAGALTLGITRTFFYTPSTGSGSTLNLNNFTLTCGLWGSNSGVARTVAFGTTGTITVIGSGTVWNMTTITGFAYTGTPTVNISNNSATAVTVVTGALAAATALNFNYTTGTYTLTDGTGYYNSLNFTGFAGTVTNATRNIYGNFTIPASGITWTAGTSITGFFATAGTQTITTNGVTLDFPMTQNGAGGTVALAGALTLGTTRTFTLTAGTLNLANFTLTSGLFNSNSSSTRVIAFSTSGAITVVGSGTVFDMTTLTGFTYTGTSKINISNNSGTATTVVAGAATAAQALNFNYTTGTYTLSDSGSSYNNIDFTGFAGTVSNQARSIYGNWTNPASGITWTTGANITTFVATTGTQTITSNGATLNVPMAKNGASTMLLGSALTLGSTNNFNWTLGTLNLNNFTLTAGSFSSNTSSARVLAFGTGAITVYGTGTVFDMTTITGLSYTGTPTVNVSNNSATAATVITGAATAAQALNFNYTTGTYTLTDASSVYNNIDYTGFAGTVSSQVRTIYGNWTNPASGITWTSGTNATSFAATATTQTITSNGATLEIPITKSAAGTLVLNGSLTIGTSRAFTLSAGTFTPGFDVTVGSFTIATGATVNMGSYTWTLSGIGTAWQTNGGTVNAGTSTIAVSDTSASAIALNFNSKTLYNLSLSGVTGTGTVTISGTNTFNSISSSRTGNYTLSFQSGTTQTITGTWGVSGTGPTNVVTLNSATPGTQFTLSKASGTVNPGVAKIQDSNATGGATYVSTSALNLGNNTGWGFTGSTNTLYWVGGSGTWDATTTTNWSNNSGGSPGGFAPDSTIAAVFDGNSGSGTVSITGNPSSAKTLTTTGSSFTFSSTGQLTLSGSMVLSATTVWSATGLLTFNAAATTLTTNGVSLACPIQLSGSAVVTLGSALTTTSALTLSAGTLTLNGFDATCLTFTGTGTVARSVNFLANFINITSTITTTVLDITNATLFSPSASTGGFKLTGAASGVTRTIVVGTTGGSSNTAPNILVAAGSDTVTITTGSFITNLNFTGYTGTFTPPAQLTMYGNLIAVSGMTWTTGTGIITFSGVNITITTAGQTLYSIIFNASGTFSLQDALTANGIITLIAGTFILNGFDATCSIFSGTGATARGITFGTNYVNITSTSTATVLNIITATSFTPSGTGGFKLTGAASGVTRTITIGTTGGSATTAPNVSVAAGSDTIDITTGSFIQTLDFTGYSGTFAPPAALTLAGGNLVASSAMTWTTGTGTITFIQATGLPSRSITTAGKQLYNLTFNCSAVTYTLQDALTVTNTLTLTAGTITLNGFNANCTTFSSTNTNTRSVVFGSNYVNITSTSTATVLDITTATGFSPSGTGGFKLTGAASGVTRTIVVGTTGGSATTAPNVSVAAGSDTVAITTASWVGDLNFTGFLGTFNPPSALNIAGSLTYVSGMTIAVQGTLTFTATTTGKTITTAGKTLNILTLNGVGGSWSLQEAVTCNTQLVLTAGSLILNGFDITCRDFQSSVTTSARSVAFGSNNINCTMAVTGTFINLPDYTNFSFTGSGIIKYTGNAPTGQTVTAILGSTTGQNPGLSLWIASGQAGSIFAFTAAGAVNNLDFTGFLGTFAPPSFTIYGSLTAVSGMTWTSGNTLTFAATSTGKTITNAGKNLNSIIFAGVGGGWTFQDATTLTSTLTLNAGAITLNGFNITCSAFNSTGSSVRSIAFGSNYIDCTSTTNGTTVISMATVTNFSFTGTGGIKASGNQGASTSRTITIGTTGGSETTAPNVLVTAGQVGSTMIITSGSYMRDLDWTGFSGTFAPPAALTIYGNLINSSGMTWTTGTGTITFGSTSTGKVITSAGKSYYAITFSGTGGSWTNNDAFSMANALTLSAGTFTANAGGYSFTAQTATLSSGTLNIGNATMTLTGNGTAFNNTGTTMGNVANSIIRFTDATTANITFAGRSQTYGNLTVQGGGGSGNIIITGNNVFNGLTSARTGVSYAIILPAGGTTTANVFSGFVGSSTSLPITIKSSTIGTQSTLSVPSGTVTVNYAKIQDSNATGGATFDASLAQNLGDNTGWTFAQTNYYWVGGAGTWDGLNKANWATTSGGTGNLIVWPPGQGDNLFFDGNSGSGNITISGPVAGNNIDMTGSSFTFNTTVSSTNLYVYGNLTLSSTTVWPGLGTIIFAAGINPPAVYTIQYLVVGGGGSGGSNGGAGGGAGAFVPGSGIVSVGTGYPITVGPGGTAQAYNTTGAAGNASTFFGTTAPGGGGGGRGGFTPNPAVAAMTGASGGGGGSPSGIGGLATGSPAAGVIGTYGYPGGTALAGGFAAAGGGGSGGVGGCGAGNTPGGGGGAGGAGRTWTYTGPGVLYAGGGGGGGSGIGPAPAGGAGAGSTGAGSASTVKGGGGGGGYQQTPTATGGAGGAGVVIIAVPTPNYPGSAPGATVTNPASAPGMTVLTYTGPGTFTA